MPASNIASAFREPGKFPNIIDADAKTNPSMNFSVPDAVKAVSLNELYKHELPARTYERGDNVK
jgi:hypothetical protein